MASDAQQEPPVALHNLGDWQELEYAGCFYCDRPWDHPVNFADGTLYLCLDCYERRFGNAATQPQADE
jgi:hypothetical protein